MRDTITDTAPKDSCWNGAESYGVICVHCGCCAEDQIEQARNRLKVLKQRLNEEYKTKRKFNKVETIRYLSKEIEHYQKVLKEVQKK